MRLRRREDSWENPAWPGLVDLFAFGMVIMLTLWVGASTLGPDVAGLQRQLREAEDRVAALERENADLRDRLGGKTRGIDEVLRELREKEIDAIRVDFKAALGDEWHPSPEDAQDAGRILINEFGGRPVVFATGRAELTPDDEERLRAFASALATIVAKHPSCKILINGTADPRPMVQTVHPKDNTELSALRAAAVARVLKDVGDAAAQRLQVTGLGEVGTHAPSGVRGEELDAFYGKYRTVTLEIQVDVQMLADRNRSSDR